MSRQTNSDNPTPLQLPHRLGEWHRARRREHCCRPGRPPPLVLSVEVQFPSPTSIREPPSRSLFAPGDVPHTLPLLRCVWSTSRLPHHSSSVVCSVVCCKELCGSYSQSSLHSMIVHYLRPVEMSWSCSGRDQTLSRGLDATPRSCRPPAPIFTLTANCICLTASPHKLRLSIHLTLREVTLELLTTVMIGTNSRASVTTAPGPTQLKRRPSQHPPPRPRHRRPPRGPGAVSRRPQGRMRRACLRGH